MEEFRLIINEKRKGFIKPLLKWAGGKSQIAPLLLSEYINKSYPLRSEFSTFYEPFVGSGIISFNCNFKRIVLGDKNTRLMLFYKEVRDRPEKLFRKINIYKDEFNSHRGDSQKSYYLELRNEFNEINAATNSGVKLSALFWILNKTGFNGMYRETKRGTFNIPYGSRPCPDIILDNVLNVSRILKKSILRRSDFERVCSDAKKGDFIYLDPPYLPSSETASFNSYLRNGFGIKEHKRLRKMMERLSLSGVSIVMSNSDSKLTRSIYSNMDGFSIKTVNVQRLISGKSCGRVKIKEIIMSNLVS